MSDNFYLKKITDTLTNSAKRREAKGRTLEDEMRDVVNHGKKPVFMGKNEVSFSEKKIPTVGKFKKINREVRVSNGRVI